MSDLKVYNNISVSAVQHDFSRHPHEAVPKRLLADWADLTGELAAAVNPAFSIPEFPETFEFTTVQIHSDDPYRSNENYYTLDSVYFDLQNDEHGIRISFEIGRQDGNDAIQIETTKRVAYSEYFQTSFIVSTHIPKAAAAPLATFYVWHDAEKTSEIESIFARHINSLTAP